MWLGEKMSLNEKQHIPSLEGKELKKTDMSKNEIFSTKKQHRSFTAWKVLFLILDTTKTILAEEMQPEAGCSRHTEWLSR